MWNMCFCPSRTAWKRSDKVIFTNLFYFQMSILLLLKYMFTVVLPHKQNISKIIGFEQQFLAVFLLIFFSFNVILITCSGSVSPLLLPIQITQKPSSTFLSLYFPNHKCTNHSCGSNLGWPTPSGECAWPPLCPSSLPPTPSGKPHLSQEPARPWLAAPAH